MALRLLALLSTVLCASLLAPLAFTSDFEPFYPISLVVVNSFHPLMNLTYSTVIAYRGILLGAMRRLQEATETFNFTIMEDLNYGPFLESVNGVAGSAALHTYWELLVELQNGTTIRPDVGVGCYIPNPNDKVILKFTTWTRKEGPWGV